jgi:lysophospholipase L1-like esterase
MMRLPSFIAGLLACLPALAAPPALEWDPADHGADIVASGASLVRNPPHGSVWEMARSSTSQSTGVRTAQIAVDSTGACDNIMVGVANGAARVGESLGASANSIGYWSNGNTFVNGAKGSVMPPAYGAGDTVAIQVDFDAQSVKFRKNAGAWSDAVPTAALGADLYVAASFCMYGDAPTPNGVHIVSDDWNDFSEPTINVVAVGDSITLRGVVLRNYVPRLKDELWSARKHSARMQRFAMNGASWDYAWPDAGYPFTLLQDGPVRVDPARSRLPNWLVAFAGTNGIAIAQHSAADEYARLQDYVRARLAAGWEAARIIIVTMMPRTGVAESTRRSYNALIAADPAGLGYKVARLDLDPVIETMDATNFPDGVHPSDALHARIAQIVARLISEPVDANPAARP